MSKLDPEVLLVAQTMAVQSANRAGCTIPVVFERWEQTSPKLYREVMEDAAAIIAALDRYRQQKYMNWMNEKPPATA